MIGILIGLGIVVFFGFVFFGWIIGTYNLLVAGRQNIKTQWSNIKTEYQRRFDMFMNLVTSVKSYKKHENKTLVEVIKERNQAVKSLKFEGNKANQLKNMGWLDSFFSKLMVVFERYPDLKANEQHNKLMDEIRITEDRVNVARTDLNDVVREYNLIVKSFPSSIIANMFHFSEEKFYMNEDRTNQAPSINLD